MNQELEVGLRVRALLDQSAQAVPETVKTRLDESIRLALAVHAQQQISPQQTTSNARPSSLINWLSKHLGQPVVSFAVSACFVAAAGFGVALEIQSSRENAAMELTALDAAILTDDLPTDAWLDPGFVSFSTEMQQRSWEDYQRIGEWLQNLDQEQPNT